MFIGWPLAASNIALHQMSASFASSQKLKTSLLSTLSLSVKLRPVTHQPVHFCDIGFAANAIINSLKLNARMDKEAIFKKLKFAVSDEHLVVNAPQEYLQLLEGINFDTEPDKSKIGTYGFVQVFASSQSEMESLIESVAQAGKFDCLFWACYPKSTGKLKYDLNRDTVWPALALANLRPVSQIAINEKWSALRGRDPELVGKK